MSSSNFAFERDKKKTHNTYKEELIDTPCMSKILDGFGKQTIKMSSSYFFFSPSFNILFLMHISMFHFVNFLYFAAQNHIKYRVLIVKMHLSNGRLTEMVMKV